MLMLMKTPLHTFREIEPEGHESEQKYEITNEVHELKTLGPVAEPRREGLKVTANNANP
jgi:hypothetical protein